MDPGWANQYNHGMYQSYHPDSRHPGLSNPIDRHQTSPHSETAPGPSSSAADDSAHRRAYTQPTQPTYLPPLTHTNSHSGGHPSFSPNFYPSYASHSTSSSAPAGLQLSYPPGGPLASAPPGHAYSYQMTSPLNPPNHLRGPLPHQHHGYAESPRVPGSAPTNWSSSPGMRPLSPTSPTTHLAPPGISASSASSSSGFPSATRTPGNLPPPKNNKRRSGSVESPGSWDEDKYGPLGELGEETEEQPWGMPQDEYKALNPRDKKQVRNRIGARRFRAKRKNYVSSLEQSIRARDDEIAMYKARMLALRQEVNELRGRLGMPMLSPSPVGVSSARGAQGGQGAQQAMSDGGLGLVVNQGEGWSPKGEEG